MIIDFGYAGGFMFKKGILIFSILAFMVSSSFSSGFTIYEQGAKATGMGGAVIAQAIDPTAIFYNPAGITNL